MAKAPVPAPKLEAPVPVYVPTLREVLDAEYEKYAMTPPAERTFMMFKTEEGNFTIIFR
jgi:hypothetical protein